MQNEVTRNSVGPCTSSMRRGIELTAAVNQLLCIVGFRLHLTKSGTSFQGSELTLPYFATKTPISRNKSIRQIRQRFKIEPVQSALIT